MKYVLRNPQVIEAMQFTGSNKAELIEWGNGAISSPNSTTEDDLLAVRSDDGFCVLIEEGDWILKHLFTYSTLSNDRFKKLYKECSV